MVILYKRALRRTDWPVAVQGLRLADEIGDAKNASEAHVGDRCPVIFDMT